MNNLNQEQWSELSFKLFEIGKRIDELYEQKKISKKAFNSLMVDYIDYWHKLWNRNPHVSENIKQAFNLLYT